MEVPALAKGRIFSQSERRINSAACNWFGTDKTYQERGFGQKSVISLVAGCVLASAFGEHADDETPSKIGCSTWRSFARGRDPEVWRGAACVPKSSVLVGRPFQPKIVCETVVKARSRVSCFCRLCF
jgi:hypothetical protein